MQRSLPTRFAVRMIGSNFARQASPDTAYDTRSHVFTSIITLTFTKASICDTGTRSEESHQLYRYPASLPCYAYHPRAQCVAMSYRRPGGIKLCVACRAL
jgi:hypothetical protein